MTKKDGKTSTKQRVKTAVAGVVAAAGIATSVLTTVPTTPPESPKVDKPSITEDVTEVSKPKSSTKDDKAKTETNKDNKAKDSKSNKPNQATDKPEIIPQPEPVSDIDLTDYTTRIAYELRDESEFAKSIVIHPDDNLSIDIIEMYLGDALIDYCLIPNTNYITSIPIMFEDLSYLEFKMYRAGTQVGSGVIRDGVMLSNVKEVDIND